MNGTWKKRGLLFAPDGSRPGMCSHAASPIPIPLDGDRVRVIVSIRDGEGRARMVAIECSLSSPAEVIGGDTPLCELGAIGTFDECGMVGGCTATADDGSRYIYYSGFQRGITVPFWFFGGLVVSDDNGKTARRISAVPVLERSDVDPIITGAPWVIRANARWRMWYTSGVRWERRADELRHYYHIKYAESADGRTWERTGQVAVDFRAGEYAIGRPCVIRDADGYHMWYSYRGATYRIGYAWSVDGLHWERRDDEAGIDVSVSGWDSEMIEYAAVFDHAGRRWMLYNGNGFGRTGIGLAEWVPA